MVDIKIDADVCRRDGLCVLTCSRGVLRQEEKDTVPEIARLDMCFGCGQCVAVCPHGALSHSEYPQDKITPIRSDYLPDYDQVLELMRVLILKLRQLCSTRCWKVMTVTLSSNKTLDKWGSIKIH